MGEREYTCKAVEPVEQIYVPKEVFPSLLDFSYGIFKK